MKELRAAYDAGGFAGANRRRQDMLRSDSDTLQSEPAPTGELTEGDMAKLYGRGFRLLAGMGFEAGSGLGREGQGRSTPVEAVDTEMALATASRHIGLGFAETAGLGGSPASPHA